MKLYWWIGGYSSTDIEDRRRSQPSLRLFLSGKETHRRWMKLYWWVGDYSSTGIEDRRRSSAYACSVSFGERNSKGPYGPMYVWPLGKWHNLVYEVDMAEEHSPAAVSLKTEIIQDLCWILSSFHSSAEFLVKVPYYFPACEASDWDDHLYHLPQWTNPIFMLFINVPSD